MMKCSSKLFLALVLCSLPFTGVWASTTSGTIGASVTLASDCTLSMDTLSFATSSALLTMLQSSVSTLQVACTKGTPYTVALSAGNGMGATTSTRKMTNTSDSSTVSYRLSQDVAHTKNWGNVVGSDTYAGVGVGRAESIPVYSTIPSGQITTVGSYTDTVMATINY